MSRSRYYSAATATILLGGLFAAPTATAADRTTSTTIPLTCQAVPSKLVGPQDFSAEEEGVTVDITAPETVTVGDEFETMVTIKPVDLSLDRLPSIATMKNVSRIKLDIAVPDGLTILEDSLDDSGSNLQGFVIKRIDANGNEDSNGRFLRIVSDDNATIGNGPNTSTDTPGGVRYDVTTRSIQMTFPVLTLKFRADTPGTSSFGIRSAGNASTYGQDENFLTMLAEISAPFVGTIWAPTRCTPRTDKDAPMAPEASALTTVTVIENVPVRPTELSISTDSVQAGVPTALSAKLTPDAAGTVTFTSGSLTSNASVSNGIATADMIFPTPGTHTVEAKFTPADPDRFLSSSTTAQVQASGQDSELKLIAPSAARANTAVEVEATLNQRATGIVEFRIGEEPSVAVPVNAGRASATLPVPDKPGNDTYTAVFIPAPDSAFSPSQVESDLTISDASYTLITLQGPEDAVTPGDKVVITAAIQPVEGSSTAEGTVRFTVDGTTTDVPVSNNGAEFTFTPAHDGTFPVAAAYTPADDSQTNAEAEFVVSAETINAVLTVTAPPEITVAQPAQFSVMIEPITDGSVTVSHDGKTETVPVVAGKASLPQTFDRSGSHDVTFDFTPIAGSRVPATSTVSTVSVGDEKYSTVSMNIEAANTVKANTALPILVSLVPDAGPTELVTGSLAFTIDGKPLLDSNGKALTMPVSRGQSAVELKFEYDGKHELDVTFVDSEGVSASASHTITVTGGKKSPSPTTPGTPKPSIPTPSATGVSLGSSSNPLSTGTNPLSAGTNPLSTGTNPLSAGTNPLSSGSSSESNSGSLSSIMSLFAPLMTWLKNIFAAFFGGSS